MNISRPYCYLRGERSPDGHYCLTKLQSFYIRQDQKWIKKGLMCPDCNKIVLDT